MTRQLDDNCGEHFSVYRNYVYFQSGNGSLSKDNHW